jgi:hypothetical protein
MTYALYSASVLVRFSWPQAKVMAPLLSLLLSLRGSSLADTSELKIPLLMSSMLSVGSTVTSSLNLMSSTVSSSSLAAGFQSSSSKDAADDVLLSNSSIQGL